MSHPVPACLPAGRRPPFSLPSPSEARRSLGATPARAPHRANFWHRCSPGAPPSSAGRASPPSLGARGPAWRAGRSRRSPRPAGPALPERQSLRNRDHKYAERRLGAAQPARRPPRLLSRRRRSPSRGRSPSPSRERVHVPAAASRQHPGPARQDAGATARHATGPEAPQPPGAPGDGHRTHPSTCDQRHFPLPGPPRAGQSRGAVPGAGAEEGTGVPSGRA